MNNKPRNIIKTEAVVRSKLMKKYGGEPYFSLPYCINDSYQGKSHQIGLIDEYSFDIRKNDLLTNYFDGGASASIQRVIDDITAGYVSADYIFDAVGWNDPSVHPLTRGIENYFEYYRVGNAKIEIKMLCDNRENALGAVFGLQYFCDSMKGPQARKDKIDTVRANLIKDIEADKGGAVCELSTDCYLVSMKFWKSYQGMKKDLNLKIHSMDLLNKLQRTIPKSC
jgi:hypothetical protein